MSVAILWVVRCVEHGTKSMSKGELLWVAELTEILQIRRAKLPLPLLLLLLALGRLPLHPRYACLAARIRQRRSYAQ